ncbi:NAD(P)H-hydrate dehydratase [Aestuariibius insulae]|uniref:NAD(P)H-hydrate dehydratase n=1 Tax=Aestuariibius insulae TaxID=2058287 RepID=UPI00345EAAEC
MTELLTAAQMRAIEEAAIASGQVTGLELMERAGRGVVEAIGEEWPELRAGSRAVVLCGPGNNGGDGFVVARLLWQAGWGVEVFLYGEPGKLPPDARVNYERWVELGAVEALNEDALFQSEANRSLDNQDPVVIDALFGTGLSRPLTQDIGRCLSSLHHTDGISFAKHVSVECPSGVCIDSGEVLGRDYLPTDTDLCVTFHRAKVGHYTTALAQAVGKLIVVDIGLDRDPGADLPEIYAGLSAMLGISTQAGVEEFRAAALSEAMEYAQKTLVERDEPVVLLQAGCAEELGKAGWTGEHKYSYGHAFILSGGVGKGGAARLAARGALRIGAGLVTVGCPPGALQENAAALDAVMLRSVADSEALRDMLEDPRINAIGVGPGLGTGAREVDLVRAVLETSRDGKGRGSGSGAGTARRLVIDADALTLLAKDEGLFGLLHKGCVLTPHGGEFARLFPDIAERLEAVPQTGPAYSKVDATREAAVRAGCVVLFKGPDTVIAAPDGQCSVNAAVYERAAPWLATAGSGDVLAGFITGLLARGFEPMQAAETAVWLHVDCARSFGPGLIADDLPEELPTVLRRLGL